ncbi:P68 family surface lipoprotein [Mycoplasma sp. Mirounga ES2805-ORL]|uniref:P68 family surface lipoprotein n=1 Tax=Mycoplasma sp. Mirounga ES2805-ORL TaxID=754514 RepID=UPI00197B6893|nr:P80 family lipoprotein [Mycoplasma sp. Mirounga ES2805-ORL]QSF13882.1 P80 family lipoprotein [Mycoplasma sp. Mirounga ES2805-ORL]
MKKNKKFLLMGLASLSGVLPVAISAGCGSNSKEKDKKEEKDEISLLANEKFIDKRFDTKNDKKVELGVTFSKGKSQWNAFEDVIKAYNEYWNSKTAEERAKAGYMEVTIDNIGSGYDGGRKKVTQDLSSKSEDLPNLITNYAPLASEIAINGMLLNFEDENKEYSTSQSLFPKSITASNNNTSNIVNKGTWIIPTLKSTHALAVNAPVLSYILETMEGAGAKINLANYEEIKTNGKTDRTTVVQKWGTAISNDQIQTILGSNYVVDESTFSVGEKIFDFAQKAQKLFTESSKDNTNVTVLGIDDISGLIPTLTFAAIDADDTEMYIQSISTNVNGIKDKKVDYKPFKNTEKKAIKKLQKIYEQIKMTIEKRALKILGDGSYTSNGQKYHEFAMGLGSTAGYYYNFIKDGKTETEFRLKNSSAKVLFGEEAVPFGKSSDGKYFYKSGKHFDQVKVDGAKYDINVKQETIDKLNAITNLPTTNRPSSDSTLLFKISTKKTDIISKLEEFAKKPEASDKFISIGKDAKEEYQLFVLKFTTDGGFEKVTISDSGFLNKNEFFAFNPISKWNENDKKDVYYSQGPSLMGIHANDEEDKATKLFVKWLTSGEKNASLLNNKAPYEYLSEEASYVFPVKGFEKNDYKGDNLYLKLAYNAYKNSMLNDEKYAMYEELADVNSDNFRKVLGQQFKNVYNKITTNQSLKDFKTEIIDGVVQNASDLFK